SLSFFRHDPAPSEIYTLSLHDALPIFRKLGPPPRQLAELMLVYVENGVEFTNQFGDINETFYSSLESVYHQTLKLLKKEGLLLRSEEHTSELQSRENLVCRLLLEKKKK